MKIEMRLFATLREGRGKVILMEVPEESAVSVLIESLEIPYQEIAILLVNGRDASLERILNDGDAVSVFPPVGGG